MSADANETMLGDWEGRDPYRFRFEDHENLPPAYGPPQKKLVFDPFLYEHRMPTPDILGPVQAAVNKSVRELGPVTERYRVGIHITVSSTLDAVRITGRPDGSVPYGQVVTEFVS